MEISDICIFMGKEEFSNYLMCDECESEARRKAALEKERRSWPCGDFCACPECEPDDYIKKNSLFIRGPKLRLVPEFRAYRLRLDFYALWRFYDSMEAFWNEYEEEDDDEDEYEEQDYEETEVVEREARKWKKAISANFL